jgi:cobalamin synthase
VSVGDAVAVDELVGTLVAIEELAGAPVDMLIPVSTVLVAVCVPFHMEELFSGDTAIVVVIAIRISLRWCVKWCSLDLAGETGDVCHIGRGWDI